MFKHYISQMQIYIELFKHRTFILLFLCFTTQDYVFFSPHRPTQMSAPTDADIRIDRRRHPHRPTQTSASTDADVRIDRRGWFVANF